MTVNLNELNLTAYVLNELSPSERAEVEAQLAADADARAFVAALRDTTTKLDAALRTETADGLTATQRAAITAATAAPPCSRPFRFRRLAYLSSLAACVAVGVGVGFMLNSFHRASPLVPVAPGDSGALALAPSTQPAALASNHLAQDANPISFRWDFGHEAFGDETFAIATSTLNNRLRYASGYGSWIDLDVENTLGSSLSQTRQTTRLVRLSAQGNAAAVGDFDFAPYPGGSDPARSPGGVTINGGTLSLANAANYNFINGHLANPNQYPHSEFLTAPADGLYDQAIALNSRQTLTLAGAANDQLVPYVARFNSAGNSGLDSYGNPTSGFAYNSTGTSGWSGGTSVPDGTLALGGGNTFGGGVRTNAGGYGVTSLDSAVEPPSPNSTAARNGVNDNKSMTFAWQSARDTHEVRDLSVPDFSTLPDFDLNTTLGNTDDLKSTKSVEHGQATIPYDKVLIYPSDWPQLTEKRLLLINDGPTTRPAAVETPADRERAFAMEVRKARVVHELVDRTLQLRVEKRYPEALALADRVLMIDANNVPAQHLRGMIQEELQAHPELRHPTFPENAFLRAADAPLSTFSLDVDTASYALVRQYLNNNERPPAEAVRLEEMVNYFQYHYDPPAKNSDEPFSTALEVHACPWAADHRLVRIGVKAKEIAAEDRPALNLVFLLDTSGSMGEPHKIEFLRPAMKMLVEQLRKEDHVAIVTYAGDATFTLSTTPGDQKQAIYDAIDKLAPNGSTHGSDGVQMAYEIAAGSFVKGGVNRVVLCTDGDWNVGISDPDKLASFIEEKTKTGVYLSVLGFGMNHARDDTMVKLADKGNGNYAYIDRMDEARKVLVDQLSGTMITVAKDVKLQLEFNPSRVAAYRLIGYEKRVLAAQDFNDDKKDAGEVGAGHTVTALYEVVPVDPKAATRPATQPAAKADVAPPVDPLKYIQPAKLTAAADSDELATLKIRYKRPANEAASDEKSTLVQFVVHDSDSAAEKATPDYKFAAAVASFGMLLRDSRYKGAATYDTVAKLANEGITGPADDRDGLSRKEFASLVERAKTLK